MEPGRQLQRSILSSCASWSNLVNVNRSVDPDQSDNLDAYLLAGARCMHVMQLQHDVLRQAYYIRFISRYYLFLFIILLIQQTMSGARVRQWRIIRTQIRHGMEMINANGHQKDSLKKPKINHHINIWNMKNNNSISVIYKPILQSQFSLLFTEAWRWVTPNRTLLL